jgi:hypothetical protein
VQRHCSSTKRCRDLLLPVCPFCQISIAVNRANE